MATDLAQMAHTAHHGGKHPAVPILIGLVVLGYVAALAAGVPQHVTQLIVAGSHAAAESHAADALGDGAISAGTAAAASHGVQEASLPPFYMLLPFVALLGAIAVLPLIPAASHWWESNANRLKVAAGLALVTLLYYALAHSGSIEVHWPVHDVIEQTDGILQVGFVQAILANAIVQEYIPFMVLLFSLYTISGGVRIEGDLRANPMTNATFMGVGGLLASLVGTTGAAMLLIRPLLETNQERKHVVHTVIFFIFIVCNCGGCLLPIGDPPLFLGYLEGVPFLWTLGLWRPWLFVNGLLLLCYLLIDNMFFYPHESAEDLQLDITQRRPLTFRGLGLNIPLLLGVVMAVALLDPNKPLPGTDWHAWVFLRETVQLALVGVALWWGSQRIRAANRFDYHAILEVAVLFLGIFICMQPALQILSVYGPDLGIRTPLQYFLITGGLSSVLDNAPTYLVFFKTAQTMPADAGAVVVAGVEEITLIAISIGAVFMGAMTYIGNGPNFMVKAIAEQSGVKMPSFFGYMAYSCVILLPILLLAAWRFLT